MYLLGYTLTINKQIQSKYIVGGGQERRNCFSSITQKPFKLELSGKTTCFTQYLSYLNQNGENSSYKFDRFMATYNSKLKWAWQA